MPEGSEQVDLKDKGEAEPRELKGRMAIFAAAMAILLTLFQLYTSFAGAFPNLIQRSIHIGFVFVLAFTLYPYSGKRSPKGRLSIPDLLIMILGVVSCIHVILHYDRIMLEPGTSGTWDLILGAIATLLVLEMTRRILSWILPVIATLAMVYAYFGPYLPEAFAHRGFSLSYILETLYLSTSGLWGIVTGVSATVVAGFLIFGSILYYTGGGEVFVDLAKGIAGRSYGGPAKVSCISSALFGTISGSAVANVVVDGVFNIPLMKRLGYRSEFAAAVEATASTGGQIMPPVMGAGAFIMAELIGIAYLKIALAAAIPALLYYLGVTASVHFEARKSNLERIPKELIPSIPKVLPKSAPLFVPVIVLIYLMVQGYDPTTAVFWSIVVSVGMYFLSVRSMAQFQEKGRNMLLALGAGGKSIVLVAALCACAQIIIGMFNLSGLGIKISEMIIGLSAGIKFLALFFTMVVCLILGMGIPTTAAYVLAASVAGPALVKLGVVPIAAHLFVFYFAIISAITPPVCAAVYAAVAIAGSNWLKTGWLAVRMGLAGFIAPYLFIYRPPVLLIGSPGEIIWASIVTGLATFALAGGVIGYFGSKSRWYENLLLFVGAGLLIKPGLLTDLLGFLIVITVYLLQKKRVASIAALALEAREMRKNPSARSPKSFS
ncbi:MAG: TRAP transporter permease [Deltaproteobacteria bacterium]|nr:TRAP transporter permease [Deltaproteobacteria bacterium]